MCNLFTPFIGVYKSSFTYRPKYNKGYVTLFFETTTIYVEKFQY
jgi:hypothetical protein